MQMAAHISSTNDSLLFTVENLLDALEEVGEMIVNDRSTCAHCKNKDEDEQSEMTEKLEAARAAMAVLKAEKWRLSKREMSVELRLGELEEYKTHLKSDMFSLNQTVDALSVRIIQLEDQLVEAQDIQETLEAQLAAQKTCLETAQLESKELKKMNSDLTKKVISLKGGTFDTICSENVMLRNENNGLWDQNCKLKELIRSTKLHSGGEDLLSKLTSDFLRELSNVEARREMK